ncbi:sigma-70 family RNA polymerase sigma factor [uncultured Gimesia sp.]|uniref:RNA polymerase sigma factor n=1 Tax=uncultured Gimesia sp. TaxID=1678688 RepID=UPI0030DCB825|tara:strand:+ start:82191 stop:82751 length:561 start_codon:yes stop_codon:yes gene_type:complete
MNIESISTNLINHASEGDPASTNRLMELSEWLLFRIANRVMDSREDAEDVVQETLAAVVKIMATEDLRLEYGRHSFLRLLKSCLRNVSANHFRKNQVIGTGGTDNLNHLQNLIDENIETVEEKRDIAEGVIELAGLTDNEKQVLKLLFLSGKSAREIAEETGMMTDNIRQIQSRALRKIRNFLGED